MEVLLRESLICRACLALWAALRESWGESRVAGWIERLGAWVSAQARESVICRFLWREGALSRSWESSLTCRVLSAVLNAPGKLCGAIYRWGKPVLDGPLIFRGIGALGRSFFLPLGLFLAVMLMVPHRYWDNRYALMAAAALTLLFIVANGARPEVKLDSVRLGPYFLLFILWAAIAFLDSQSRKESLRFVAFYLILFLVVLLTVSGVESYRQLEGLLALVVAGLSVAALYGCYQAAIGVQVVASQQDMLLNAGMPGRIYSFFDNPNNFAELLVMFTPFALALFLNASGWRGRLAALLALGVSTVALGATYSRSGWLGIVLALMVFLLLENWRLLPLMLLAGLCCVPLLPTSIYNRILTIGNTSDTSTSYRFAIYKAAGDLLKDYWLKGVGLGSDVLKSTFENYDPLFDGNYPIHTHNNYLQVWAEMGLFGALSFLATLCYQLKNGVKAYWRTTDKRLKRVLAAALSGFCGILLISIAEYTWFYPRNMFLYWALFGIIAACIKLAGRERCPSSEGGAQV